MIIGVAHDQHGTKSETAQFLARKGFSYWSATPDRAEENRIVRIGEVLQHLDADKHHVVDGLITPEDIALFRQRGDFHCILERRQATLGAELAGCLSCVDSTVDMTQNREAINETIVGIIRDVTKKIGRPDWDQYFMGIAKVVAVRSNCIKRKVAAVVVRDKRVIATGYNGTPRGITNCDEGGCPRCYGFADSGASLDECLCSHAEENAITQSAYHGVCVRGATIYTTFSPCLNCTKLIINSGIAEVAYQVAYSIAEVPLRLLKEAGVVVRQIK